MDVADMKTSVRENVQQPPPPAPLAGNRWHILLWGGIFLLLVGMIQFSIPSPMDGDTLYHAAVGRMIRRYGILHAFPWTPFSWLADHYADKELLFHLFFATLGGLDWKQASQIVGTVCGAGILLTIYLILRTERVRHPWLWALIPLAASHTFVYRFSIVRPHLLSISLALIVLWAATRGRLKILAAAGLIYPWTYVAWHLPLILVAIAETSRFLSTRKVQWQPAVTAVCSVAAGIALHPNATNLVRLFWIQIVEVLFRTAWGAKAGFDLGLEFLPETAEGWVRGLLISLVMVSVALYLGWKNRRDDVLPLAFALTAAAFALMTAKSSRFLEYFVPFSVAALGLSAISLRVRFLPQALLALSLMYTLSLNGPFLRSFSQSPDCLPPQVTKVMQEAIPTGAQVFTPDWASTGSLMLALPERRFIVGLDPTFFFMKDSALYRLWYTISHDAPLGTVDRIKKDFQSRYVLCFYPNRIIPQEWSPLMQHLASDRRVTTTVLDDLWVLFDLGPAEQPADPEGAGQ